MGKFTNTIDAIGDEETLRRLISDELTTYYDDFEIKSICSRAFYSKKSLLELELSNTELINDYSLWECFNLTKINLPTTKTLNQYSISDCYCTTDLSIPEVEQIKPYNFRSSFVGIVSCPKATTLGTYLGTAHGASGFDFSQKVTILANAFSGGHLFSTLILRSSTMCSLAATNAFNLTTIGNGLGWIYVPSELVNTYKTATNWSTFADQIVSIDEYPKEFIGGTITDTWTQIFAAEANGTYKTKYSIGDTKALNMNGACVLMQIVAFDEDDLADDSGKAKITWMSVGLVFSRNMNPTSDSADDIWEKSELRKYMHQTVLPTIDINVQNNIKPVKKVSFSYDANVTTTDSVWIPSFYEITGGSSASYTENTGAAYSTLFSADSGRIKKYNPCGFGNAAQYYLRTVSHSQYSTTASARAVSSNGNVNATVYLNNATGIVLGFCT